MQEKTTRISLPLDVTVIILDAAVNLFKINKLKALLKGKVTEDAALEAAIATTTKQLKSATGAE